MVKILLLVFLLWALYFLGKRYRHRWSPRVYRVVHGLGALLTLGGSLPASLLNHPGVPANLRLGLGWGVGSLAFLYAVGLAWKGAGAGAAAGSLQAGKYLLPAALGIGVLGLRTAARSLAQQQLPLRFAQYLERRSLFLVVGGTGIWLMAAFLHAYLNDGFSNPSLAPWVNNAYWLVALGMLGWATLAEGRQYWMLRRLQGLFQQRVAVNVSGLARRAQRLFPGSWRGAVWSFVSHWAEHQQARGLTENVQLDQALWVFERQHYVDTLLAFLELPIYLSRQRQACRDWLAQAFQLPEDAASALLLRVETNTA